jgi:L-fuconolactonase
MVDSIKPALNHTFLPPNVKEHLDRNNIEGVVKVQAGRTHADNAWWLGLADEYSYVLGVIGWVDFTNPAEAADWLDEFGENSKFLGVRPMLEEEPDVDWVLQESVRQTIAAIAERDLILELLVFPRHLKHLPDIARRHSEMRININHLAKPAVPDGTVDDWKRDIAAIAAFPNITFKVSALVEMWDAFNDGWTVADSVTPFARFIRAEAGIERLFWASDWPVVLMAGDYDDSIESTLEGIGELTSEEEAMLFGENAAEFYRL